MEPLKQNLEHDRRPADTGPAISALQRELGLSSGELAASIGVSAGTVERWRTGIYAVPKGEANTRLNDLLDLQRQLRELISSEAEAQDWLNTRRAFLGNLSPIEVIRAGRADRVRELLTAIEHGIYV